MCGIIGISWSSNTDKDEMSQLCNDLFTLSESRGKEASGIVMINSPFAKILRMPEKASILVKNEEYKKILDLSLNSVKNAYAPFVIGNTRLATNGSAYKSTNNQPVITSDTIGVHNGMIVNELELWKKFSSIRREFDIDTEVILKLSEYFIKRGLSIEESVSAVFDQIKGAASIILLNRFYPKIVVATNTGSVYYSYTKNKLFVIASEEYILKESLKGKHRIDKLEPGKGMSFGLETFDLTSFSLKTHVRSKKLKKSSPIFRFEYINNESKSFEFVHESVKNKLRFLKEHVPDFKAIEKIRRCTRCILPETMPLISFDTYGICNFCRTSNKIVYKGKHKLIEFLERDGKKIKNKKCIVALSGGRDSSYGLHYVKNILGMDPIAYTYDWGMVTDIARRNQYRLTSEMGVEHIIVSADIRKKRENIRKNVLAWLKRPNLAMIPLFMAGDKQAEYFAEQVKRQTKTDLMIYCRGNELEDERFKFGYYGIFDGTPGGVLHNLSWMGKVQMAAYYAREYLFNPSYINSSLVDTVGAYFSAYLMSHEFVYLWHYIPWDENEIISTLKGRYGWESPTDTIATWRIDDGTPPFYNYIYYKVQGFTEHDGLRSNQIRQGIITRKEALELVKEENKPRYEALQWYFDTIKIDGDKALTIVDTMPTKY